ncbi:DUF2752 domain-containing protein [Candidatus Woesearchaeota archaeon]|nr:DUF2752 domain-containing protein [Candidatus Woesearchaeota archaeon]
MKPAKLKKIVLDLISFNTPQAIVFNLVVILLVLALLPTSTITTFPSSCIFKNFILPAVYHGDCPDSGLFAGCECPACGLTRAMSRLLHGDFAGAWDFNPLVFLVFPAMLAMIGLNLKRSLR